MRHLACLLLFLSTIYVVEYEGHYWNTCSGGTCLTIHCGNDLRGCYQDPTVDFCADHECVKKILDQHGTEYLKGIWRVNWVSDGDIPWADIKRLEPVRSYDVKEKTK